MLLHFDLLLLLFSFLSCLMLYPFFLSHLYVPFYQYLSFVGSVPGFAKGDER